MNGDCVINSRAGAMQVFGGLDVEKITRVSEVETMLTLCFVSG